MSTNKPPNDSYFEPNDLDAVKAAFAQANANRPPKTIYIYNVTMSYKGATYHIPCISIDDLPAWLREEIK